MTVTTATRAAALAKHLECDADEVSESTYQETIMDGQGGEWLVLTDDEADEAVAEYIGQSVWAFTSWFLADHAPDGITADHIDAMRGDSCEDFNDPAIALVEAGKGMQSFIEAAISADGIGHFLSGYDGEEHEVDGFLIYRTN